MFGGRLEAQCGTAEAGARGIVLRRVHATAQDVAIVPLQRIGAGQAVIGGQRQGLLDRGHGGVGGDRPGLPVSAKAASPAAPALLVTVSLMTLASAAESATP